MEEIKHILKHIKQLMDAGEVAEARKWIEVLDKKVHLPPE
jgi:hypothetical protein